MHAMKNWLNFDMAGKANLVWTRITFSRLTIIYFVVACIHCTIQVIFQAQALAINNQAEYTLWGKMVSANQTQEANGFAVLGDDLRICYTVPASITIKSCQRLWDSGNSSSPSPGLAAAMPANSPPAAPLNGAKNQLDPSPSSVTSTASQMTASLAAVPAPSNTSTIPAPQTTASLAAVPASSDAPVVTIAEHVPSRTTIVIRPTASPSNQKSTTIVIVPEGGDVVSNVANSAVSGSRVRNKRSSLTTGTPTAELNDSCIRALIWPVQTLSNTKREDITFIGFQFWVLGMSIVALLNESIPHSIAALVTHVLSTTWAMYQIFETERFRRDFNRIITNGVCNHNHLLGSYWERRKNVEISSAVLNIVTLMAFAFLTYKLVKLYGWQTFKRVGASLTINRVYRLVLSLSISIQLALFFLVSAMALWIDQLYNGIGRLMLGTAVFKITFIIAFVLLLPWLSLGWFSVRRESRKMALLFLILSLLFIGCWAAMFDSKSFRWTFATWEFFSAISITAVVLMISTFILGLACRLNFGKGLFRYLNAEEPLDGDNFEQAYPGLGEKDPEKVEFPSPYGNNIPTFSVTFPRERETVPQMGSSVQAHQGHSANGSISSQDLSLSRIETSTSQKSSSSSSSTRPDMMGKRWIIE